MDSASSFIVGVSQEEFFLFHNIDRTLYEILVLNLLREPAESTQILALWLWLERMGYRNVVKKILSLPIILINEVADEAVTCLNCINNGTTTSSSSSSSSYETPDISLHQSLMDKEISLQFLYQNRFGALQGVAKMVQDVCVRAMSDIMQQVSTDNSRMVFTVMPSSSNRFCFGSFGPLNTGHGEVMNMQRNVTPENEVVPADDRTLFVTFSKGYRVQEWEVREFFTRAYGDCIEALFMREVQQPNEQALFARLVFHKTNTIDMILRGASKAKFNINGKHVWARRFVPKRRSSSLPTSSQLAPRE